MKISQVGWILFATWAAAPPALAQDAAKSEVNPSPLLELVAELQHERKLIPHCPKAFACKWGYFNVQSGKHEIVMATGATDIRNCHLMVSLGEDEESLAIPIPMMDPEAHQLLRQYVSYSKRCHQALSNMVAANGGSPEFAWTDNKGLKHSSKVSHVLLQSESGTMTLSPPKALSLYAVDAQALSFGWIPWNSFSQASRVELLGMALSESKEEASDKAGVDSAFPRNEIPSFNQSDFKGGQSANCGPNALANFLIWWDRIGLLPLPVSKREEKDRAEWVHDRLYGAMRSGGGTSSNALVNGFKSYLGRYYPGIVTAKFIQLGGNYKLAESENLPFTLKAGSDLVQEGNATILAVTQIEKGRPVGRHYVSLTSLDPEGNVTLNTWGYRFRGRLKQLSESEIKQLPPRIVSYELRWGGTPTVFELVVENPSETMSRVESRWFVMPCDSLLIIKPEFRR